LKKLEFFRFIARNPGRIRVHNLDFVSYHTNTCDFTVQFFLFLLSFIFRSFSSVISALLTYDYEWSNNYFDFKEKLWVHYKPSLFQHIGTHSSLKVSKLYITGITKYIPIYLKYGIVCPRRPNRDPLIPSPRGGLHTLLRVRGWGPPYPQFGSLEKKPSTLSTLAPVPVYPIHMQSVHWRMWRYMSCCENIVD
jgi:hypothetical protein